MKAVIIGAGKIGRGLIAGICQMNGIGYSFIENDGMLTAQMQKEWQYLLHVLERRERVISMKTAEIWSLEDTEAAERAILDADLIFTAVGGKHLGEVGEYLGERLEHILTERSCSRPLNIIVHENWKYTERDLHEGIRKMLSLEKRELFEEIVGINMALSMGLSVEPPDEESKKTEPLGIWMQDRWNIFVNKALWKGDLPKIKGVGFVDHFLQLQNQALYTNNASSAVISYLGQRKGYQYVAEAARDPEIERIVDEAYQEIETALIRQLHVFPKDQREFARQAREKYRDERIHDTVVRHARDPIRKLGPEERLLAPARMAMASGIRPTALAAGIAAALYYEDENDPSACELKHLREKNGIPAVLREICGLEEGCELEKLILEQVQNLFCQDKKMTE